MTSPRKQSRRSRARKPRQPAPALPDITAELTELHLLIGRNVRDWRARRGLTLEQLGRRARVTPRTIARIERGAGNMRTNTLYLIADGLEINGCQLYEGDRPIYERIWKKRPPAAARRSKP